MLPMQLATYPLLADDGLELRRLGDVNLWHLALQATERHPGHPLLPLLDICPTVGIRPAGKETRMSAAQ